jgi:hypothetical protein
VELHARHRRAAGAAAVATAALVLAGLPGAAARAALSGDQAGQRSVVVVNSADAPRTAAPAKTVTLVTGDGAPVEGAGARTCR